MEILADYTTMEELDQDVANDAAAADSSEDVADSAATAPGAQTTDSGSTLYLLDGSYLDDAGYLHVPDGSLTLRVKNYKGSLQRIFLNLDFLYNQPVLAEVFARDEGNSYPYSLGGIGRRQQDGRCLSGFIGSKSFKNLFRGSTVGDRNSSAHNREKTDRRSYADHQGAGITGFFCCSTGKLWHKSTSHIQNM